MDFTLALADSGALLERLGMGKVVRGGKGSLTGSVSWPGSPLSPDYGEDDRPAQGRDRRRASSSRPARARRGCSACSACSRCRGGCSLDFRDLFEEGFAFDNVAGDLKHRRRAWRPTNNLRMRGAAAVVLMEGEADIERETAEPARRRRPRDQRRHGVARLCGHQSGDRPRHLPGAVLPAQAARRRRARASSASPGRGTIRRSSGSSAATFGRSPAAEAPDAAAAAEPPKRRRAEDEEPDEDRRPADGLDAERREQPRRGPPPAGARRARGRRAGRPAGVLLLHGPKRPRQARDRRGAGRGADPAHARRDARASTGSGSIGGTLAAATTRRGDGAATRDERQPRLLAARRAGRALRQDPPVPLRQRPRAATTKARTLKAGSDAGRVRCRRPARGPERLLRPALSRALSRADAGRRATCSACRRPSPITTGSPTGKCCCARARSRTSATSSRRRRAACTRTAGAPSATAWSSTPGARSSRAAARAKASSPARCGASASPKCACSCRRSSIAEDSDGGCGVPGSVAVGLDALLTAGRSAPRSCRSRPLRPPILGGSAPPFAGRCERGDC